ncbi:MAG: TerD family protein [Armatimonadota bacterium]
MTFIRVTEIMDRINNSIYLRRRGKIVLPTASGNELLPENYVATAAKNLETLGAGFSTDLIAACRTLTLDQLTLLYQELTADLKKTRGAHKSFKPMYPNFPRQVMDMSQVRLYFNALVHYWSGGKLFPATEVKERLPLLDMVELTRIDLGSQREFEALFAQIAASNTSLSEQDKEDLQWFVETYSDTIRSLMPEAIPQKENLAFVASLLMRHTMDTAAVLQPFFKTATDILRLALALSGGDVSLADSTKFRTFSRKERRLLLSLLERLPGVTEDMLRWKGRWIRLGEKLHPGEFASRYPNAASAFQVLRDNLPFATFNSGVEEALAKKNVGSSVAKLSLRPGDFARRLDHLLRISKSDQDDVVTAFAAVASRVSTPFLLQVMNHFEVRNDRSGLRVFFPKGNLAKAQGILNTLPDLPEAVCERVSLVCREALEARFRALSPLGRVYIDENLRDYPVPFAMRSASKTLRSLVRGSRLPLPLGCSVLRFFVWWKNGADTTDIDLSAAMFSAEFRYIDVLSYYNLKGFGGVHSGDIVDAPNGASEFIDVTLEKLRTAGVRYVAMTLNSYSRQPFVQLPECFAGWMARQEPDSGEIYEPKTVQDRVDLTADTRIALPLVIDVVAEKVIWCDMALRNHPRWQNNVHGNLSGVQLTLQSLVDLKRASLYDLFALHTAARGEQVSAPEEADTLFSVEAGTPYRQEEIASQYLV